MAIKNRVYPCLKLILHFDNVLQYCNPSYTHFAESNGMILNITEQYDPYKMPLQKELIEP